MESVKQRFCDLTKIIEGVHAIFDQFEIEDGYDPSLNIETLLRAKWAVHEWTANIVQHADFNGRNPEVVIDVWTNGGNALECLIEDNSEGFNLEQTLEEKSGELHQAPVPERGMGLLMLNACATDLRYERTEDGRFRLRFTVRGDQDPHFLIPFLSGNGR